MKKILLLGVSAAAIGCHAPLTAATPVAVGTAVAATAAESADAAGDAGDAGTGEVVVLGFGQSRQVQDVGQAEIARLVPGTSPLKAIEKLPGVNFQAADPFGAYEWAVRISLRGFNQNQLGFTLDDVPLGDLSYGNVNGLHISRAILSEDIGRISVAQGSGALGTASTSNLGGTIQFYSRRPSDRAEIAASGTYGSDDTYRGFVRIDSGDLGGGLKGYLSYGYLKTDKWKGVGEQRQHQADARIEKDLGPLGRISAFLDFSDRRETDYQDLSLDIIRRLGLRDDNIGDNYPLALQIARAYQAGTAIPAPYATVDDAYFDAGGLRRDYLGGVSFDAHLAPGLDFKTTGYYHDNRGQGSWITPYVPTPNGAPDRDGTPIAVGAPVSYRTTEYSIHRAGVVSRASYEVGANRFEVGGWYESNSFRQARRFYGMANGTTPNRDTLKFQSNPFFTQWNGKYDTETIQYFVQDTLKLLDDRLTLNAGWKGFHVINRANLLTGSLARGRIDAKDWFQPQAGIVFHLSDMAELFANYTENLRAFTSSATSGPFSTTQAGFDAIRTTLKPERSKTYEGGVRLRAGGKLQASAVGYYIDFSNRLLAFPNGAGIIGNPSTLNNVGKVRSYGAEVTANYRVVGPLSLFGSYSYNKATYRDDVVNARGVLLAPTDGKTVVDTPRHQVKGEIVYDDGTIVARSGVDYQSKRYFTYLNDQSVAGRAIVDASLAYRFHGMGLLDGVSIEGSVTNLTNKKYIGTIGSNGFGAAGDNQTLLAGAPRQWFVSLRKGF